MFGLDSGFLIIFSYMVFISAIMTYLINTNIKKYNKLSYVTELSSDDIASRMALQNIKDNIKFKCIKDDIDNKKFIFDCIDIMDDWHYKPGHVVYEMHLEPRERGTFIFLFVIERSSLTAQLKYSEVMNKFMKNKLKAQFCPRG